MHSSSLRFQDTGDNNDNSYQPNACACNRSTISFKPPTRSLVLQLRRFCPFPSPSTGGHLAMPGDSLGCHSLRDTLGVPRKTSWMLLCPSQCCCLFQRLGNVLCRVSDTQLAVSQHNCLTPLWQRKISLENI